MTTLSGLSAIADRYDGLLLDLWGVIHDGTDLYPGVHHALTQLRRDGKKIIMLSNAPRRARKVAKVLGELGIEPALYDAVVSSGEVGYQWLQQFSSSPLVGDSRAGGKPHISVSKITPPLTPPSRGGEFKRTYYYIGPDKDLDVADGLNFTCVDALADAEFLLNVGFGSEEQSTADWLPLLHDAKQKNLPMVCLNPDLEVVKLSGERFACAGVIGHAYEALGGKVIWFGKPFNAVYDECLRMLSPIPKPRLLAIGDSVDTDIPGAESFGIDCVLISGGILKIHTAAEIEAMCRSRNLSPTYIMPQLAW